MTQKKDPLDFMECRARARKLRADAARERVPDKREQLLTMAREYEALADELERSGTR